MVMSEKDSERSFYINWPVFLMYSNRFGKVFDGLEARGCISKDLASETKKKIAEVSELIISATEEHDKDKASKAEDLFNEIMQTLFKALDNCFDKGLGYEVS
jgi:hypothetical protein